MGPSDAFQKRAFRAARAGKPAPTRGRLTYCETGTTAAFQVRATYRCEDALEIARPLAVATIYMLLWRWKHPRATLFKLTPQSRLAQVKNLE